MAFWSEAAMSPKRNYRWVMSFSNIPQWIIKKVNKPGFTISEATHQYLNHTFYYPGRVEYEKTSITLVDPVTPDATAIMMEILSRSGYAIPLLSTTRQTISKANAVDALKTVSISQLDGDGEKIDQFQFHNAWLTSAKFGDLDYSNDELTEIQIELRYDFVTMTKKGSTDFNQHLGTNAGKVFPTAGDIFKDI